MKTILILFCILTSNAVMALSCNSRAFPEEYNVADVVILATATKSNTDINGEPELVKLHVKEYFKESFSTIEFVHSEPSKEENVIYLLQAFPKIPLEKDKDYVIFGKRIENNVITSNVCRGNFSIDNSKAKNIIDKLRKLKVAIKHFKEP